MTDSIPRPTSNAQLTTLNSQLPHSSFFTLHSLLSESAGNSGRRFGATGTAHPRGPRPARQSRDCLRGRVRARLNRSHRAVRLVSRYFPRFYEAGLSRRLARGADSRRSIRRTLRSSRAPAGWGLGRNTSRRPQPRRHGEGRIPSFVPPLLSPRASPRSVPLADVSFFTAQSFGLRLPTFACLTCSALHPLQYESVGVVGLGAFGRRKSAARLREGGRRRATGDEGACGRRGVAAWCEDVPGGDGRYADRAEWRVCVPRGHILRRTQRPVVGAAREPHDARAPCNRSLYRSPCGTHHSESAGARSGRTRRQSRDCRAVRTRCATALSG